MTASRSPFMSRSEAPRCRVGSLAIPVSLLLLAVLVAGCARAPVAGEPTRPEQLEELARELNAAGLSGSSFRGSGSGEIRASGRTLDVSFALVYERPQWLRADLRPALGTMGANLTALALMEGDCARLYFPTRLVVVTGCLSDVAGRADWLDPAAFLLGLPDASFLTRLIEARSTRDGDRLTIYGRAEGTRVRVDIDETGPFITDIEIEGETEEERLRVSYGGHGWKDGAATPREVELVALEGTSREITVRVRFEKLRSSEPVDRESYALDVPPGVLEVDWKDLSIWR